VVVFMLVLLPVLLLLTCLPVRAPWRFSDSISGGVDCCSSIRHPLYHP
jgi:hypothetical protein